MKALILNFLLVISCLVTVVAFQNCGKEQILKQTDESSYGAPQVDDAAIPTAEVAPIDAKQTLASMMSLVNVKSSEINQAEINSENNFRLNLLVSDNDIRSLNSPSMIALTSLAGTVCKQAVAKEKAGAKDLFLSLDFKKGPGANGKTKALNVLLVMSDRFWMRKPSKEEMQIFTEIIDDYFRLLSAAALSQPIETDKLSMFLCTGMLASPDSYML